MLIAYGLSWAFFGIFIRVAGYTDFAAAIATFWNEGRVPWSLLSPASMVAACTIIAVYLIINAWFLEPYLGDAARYFRNSPANVAVRRMIRKNAVDTLANLHASGYYDRIVVVAHSLGSVVAYDMLRAYYSRICDWAPLKFPAFEPEFTRIDKGGLTRPQLRKEARKLVRKMAAAQKQVTPLRERQSTKGPQAWLVTDFVTLGAALEHAKFLMCHGKNRAELEKDFARRVEEREFPTCPPAKDPPDGWLAYTDPNSNKKRLHHGGLFALTRWTNIYFPMDQVFWGDAIGGPLDPVFGDHIEDVEVWTDSSRPSDVFTHTKYWDTTFKQGRNAPHIAALRDAINLTDK
jgi:preprotein translocase subunit Sec61beta